MYKDQNKDIFETRFSAPTDSAVGTEQRAMLFIAVVQRDRDE